MSEAFRVCKRDGCPLEAAPRRQYCEADWLAKQPPVVRAEAAKRRRELIPEEYRQARVHKDDWPAGRRWCAGCQTFMRLEDCGSGSQCRACTSAAGHISRMKADFGIDPATYQWLLEKQLNRCAICRTRPKSKRLAVDA